MSRSNQPPSMLNKPKESVRFPSSRHPVPRQQGSSVLLILVLLACMAMLITINTSNLHVLKQELKRIDKRQQQKAWSTTNGHG